jgi:DNA-binding NarL/FixJ family response regulator
MDQISVAVAVKTRIYRDGIAGAISSHGGMRMVAAVADVASAQAAIASLEPDIVILDISLDQAIDLCPAIHLLPSAKLIAVAVNCAEGDDELIRWAEAGAAGFVTSENTLDDLLTVICATHKGELLCSPRISAALLRHLQNHNCSASQPTTVGPKLTPRQHQILGHIRSGLTNKQIARELGIELATVKNHVHYLLKRLDMRRRYEVTAIKSSIAVSTLGRDERPRMAFERNSIDNER